MTRKTRAVKAGSVIIGGGFPVSIQTMTRDALSPDRLSAVVQRIEALRKRGCDLVRFAVPDLPTAELLGSLSTVTDCPLVADVHFDYRIALRCLDFPLAKVRINPGTIGDEAKVRDVVAKAKDRGIALRVGVNAGSLPNSLDSEPDLALAMVTAAEMELEILERLGFSDVVFSLKSSDIGHTVKANEMFARKYDYPLHVGLTEAGPLVPGLVKNSIAISDLLKQGIGDTIRVSLSGTEEEEVEGGLSILRAVGARRYGVNVISCPRCGRSTFDVKSFLEQVSDFIQGISRPLTIAVMGCEVNGPGEARRADIGITGAGTRAIIFRGGKVLRQVPFEQAASAFRQEVGRLCEQG